MQPAIWSPLPERDFSGGYLVITSPMGPRLLGGVWHIHYGVDLGTTDGIENGVPINPVLPMKLIAVQRNDAPGSEGLNCTYRDEVEGHYWKNFHTSLVMVGDIGHYYDVTDTIAQVGGTGGVAPHLHIEEHIGSRSNPVDCTPRIRDAIANRRYAVAYHNPLPPLEEAMPLTDEEIEEISKRSAIKLHELFTGDAQAEGQGWGVNATTGEPYPALFDQLRNVTVGQIGTTRNVLQELAKLHDGHVEYSAGYGNIIVP